MIGESILADVQTMIKALEADKACGPYMLYVPRPRGPRRVKQYFYCRARNRRRERLVLRWFRRHGGGFR